MDTDALDVVLVAGPDDPNDRIRVPFTYEGVEVAAGSDGEITLRPQGAIPE